MKKILATLAIGMVASVLAFAQFIPAMPVPVISTDPDYSTLQINCLSYNKYIPTNIWQNIANLKTNIYATNVWFTIPRYQDIGIWMTYSNGPGAAHLSSNAAFVFAFDVSPNGTTFTGNQPVSTTVDWVGTNAPYFSTTYGVLRSTNLAGVRAIKLYAITNYIPTNLFIKTITFGYFHP